MTKSVGKKLKKFSVETRLKSSEDFKNRILDMFKGYIKSVIVFGSFMKGQGTGKSDVDIYIIFDDTKMPLKKFEDIRSKIDEDIYKVAASIDPRLHPQPILALTEFIKGIRYTHPLFFNIIREGYAIYDTGFFIPMRKLLEWGEFPITPEAAHMRMEGVPKRITRVKSVKLYMIAEDMYYALLDAAQAVLMYVGVGPPAPKTAAQEVRKHLVDAGLLEEEYAQLLQDICDFRKKVENKEIKDISGKEVDEWIKKTEKYVERFEKLLKDLEFNRKAYDIKRSYEVMVKASVAALKSLKKLPKEPEKLPVAFKKYLVDAGLVNPTYSDVFDKVIQMRKLLDEKKIGEIKDRDIFMSREYVRRFVADVSKFMKTPLPQEPEDKMEQAKQVLETAKEISKINKKPRKKKAKK
ncbi:MAG: nucleotidyltransferase domain-containing protein [Candidatus Aenigmatarchaeota archaeon]